MASADIVVLKFPENVRTRKEMYLFGSNHAIQEIIDNAVDEFNAGRAKHISLTVTPEERMFPRITICDDGGGIPTKPSNDPDHAGECMAEVALGNLTAGGKFGKEGGYQTVTSGLHGVGASCTNAVSSEFKATIWHDKTRTVLEYEKGILKNKIINEPFEEERSGTEISFILDETLWKDDPYDLSAIKKRLKQLSYLNSGLEFIFIDKKGRESFLHKDGLVEYYKDLTSAKEMLHTEPVVINKTNNYPEVGEVSVNLALGYHNGFSSETYGFVNNVITSSGDHLTGLNQGVAKAISSFYAENDKYKNLVKNLTADDCREGMMAILSVRVMYPKFEGQSKTSIKMPQVRTAVNQLVVDELKIYLEQHPSFVKALGDKLEKAIKARIAAKRARDAIRSAKSTLENNLPGKLAACSSKNPEECAIYIVEGDSAAGSAIQGRDPKTQAILPVFGKVLNSTKAREDEVLKSEKLLDVIKALKCGIGKTFDIKKLRYHKIIIMSDADVDGSHIGCLWITFFWKYLPELVKNGYLYLQLSPLYRVTEYINKKEEKTHYFFNDEELNAFKTKNKTHVAYIKGLGELQPKQLWESTMNPENRRLIQVTVEDAEEAERAIDICMGDNVSIRRQFILDSADFSKVVE